ncbi:uncharacterized protein RJT21DRAFT_123295 [Scheffersomyces amazonensis]|uniref:uncharacterized protein n=1 Tax=Scheffersomyces amazonensis TaxID=1078765 RepID=UPI00315DAF47
MASQSSKKQAQSNIKTLFELHVISLVINILSILGLFVLHRPSNWIPWIIISLPAWGLQYFIEKGGRPRYNGEGKMTRVGDDLKLSGSLYEYFFDIIYVTWFLDILMIIFGTNYVWFLYSVIPIFAGYKIFGFVAPFLKKSKGPVGADTSSTGTGADTGSSASGKSKRQQKLEARRDKGPSVKYR